MQDPIDATVGMHNLNRDLYNPIYRKLLEVVPDLLTIEEHGNSVAIVDANIHVAPLIERHSLKYQANDLFWDGADEHLFSMLFRNTVIV